MNRQKLAHIAAGTMGIIEAGKYTAPDGKVVSLGDTLDVAVQRTVCIPPRERIPGPGAQGARTTVIRVEDATTLVAAKALYDRGLDPVALNFASARNPGGGFLRGAPTQEEYLCRLTGLYPCLKGQPMYAWHRDNPGSLYASWVIYSPGVPVFRGEDFTCLDTPWKVAIITSPAPNVHANLLNGGGETDLAIAIMLAERAGRILALACCKGHDSLVLGAWGCGVFGCNPGMVAGVFRDLLAGTYRGVFSEVVFAVPAGPNQEAFQKCFRA